jgi:catechol 2,3-dioxygenase-like lactoylglutathione lyase family enzyme
MIDHVSVRVQDFGRLVDFYREALAPIGYQVLMEYPGAVGLGADGKPDLWLMQTDQPLNPTHVALSSGSRSPIDAFYAAGLAAGGSDNGAPGVRLDYHPTYYAAFVRDPEGNNIEVVCHMDPNAKAARPAAKSKPKAKAKVKTKAAARKPAAKPMGKTAKGKAKAKPKAKKRR